MVILFIMKNSSQITGSFDGSQNESAYFTCAIVRPSGFVLILVPGEPENQFVQLAGNTRPAHLYTSPWAVFFFNFKLVFKHAQRSSFRCGKNLPDCLGTPLKLWMLGEASLEPTLQQLQHCKTYPCFTPPATFSGLKREPSGFLSLLCFSKFFSAYLISLIT